MTQLTDLTPCGFQEHFPADGDWTLYFEFKDKYTLAKASLAECIEAALTHYPASIPDQYSSDYIAERAMHYGYWAYDKLIIFHLPYKTSPPEYQVLGEK